MKDVITLLVTTHSVCSETCFTDVIIPCYKFTHLFSFLFSLVTRVRKEAAPRGLPCRMQVINRVVPSLFTNETRRRVPACKHIQGTIVNADPTTRLHEAKRFFQIKVGIEWWSYCFPLILWIEIFQNSSVGAVSYNCTDDNKYRARRAVKSNRLRLWALYNQQQPVARRRPRCYNLLTCTMHKN